jgi:hypothetical protein
MGLIEGEGVREWMRTMRGIVAAAGVALLALGAVLLAWPRRGGVLALAAGVALLLMAWSAGILRELKKKLHITP